MQTPGFKEPPQPTHGSQECSLVIDNNLSQKSKTEDVEEKVENVGDNSVSSMKNEDIIKMLTCPDNAEVLMVASELSPEIIKEENTGSPADQAQPIVDSIKSNDSI